MSFERPAAGGYSLSVANEGKGLPADFDPAASTGLGMKVVRSLARQLGGELLVGTAEGPRQTTFTVSFAEAARAKPH